MFVQCSISTITELTVLRKNHICTYMVKINLDERDTERKMKKKPIRRNVKKTTNIRRYNNNNFAVYERLPYNIPYYIATYKTAH